MNCYWIQDALMSFIIFVCFEMNFNKCLFICCVVCVYCFKFCIAYCTFHFANLKLKGLYYKERILKNCWKNSIFPLGGSYIYMIFRVAVFIDGRVSHFTRSIRQYPLCSVHTEQIQCPFGRVCSTVYNIHHFRWSSFFLNSTLMQ